MKGAPHVTTTGPLRDHYDVVVVGGGVNGLGLARHLAEAGTTRVLVLERGYLLQGASGRNGGGVRAQWGTADNIVLARDSLRMWREMSAELGFNIWFRQGGYLFLAHDEERAKVLRETVAFHNAHGVKSRFIDAAEANVLVPELNVKGVVGATYHAGDGILFPWAVVFGLAKRCTQLGVDVRTFTEATDFEHAAGRVRAVMTSRGRVTCDWVVNAAGCWSRDVSMKLGVEMPNLAVRHEILVTEALKPVFDPMIVDLRNGLYASQDMRGEIVCGIGTPSHRPGVNLASSYAFTTRVASALLDLLPNLGEVNVLRQWAGAYDVTPDSKPVLGPTPGFDNFLQLNGASGHGFMVSPVTTRLVADIILGRKPMHDLAPYLLARFAQEGYVPEKERLVIG